MSNLPGSPVLQQLVWWNLPCGSFQLQGVFLERLLLALLSSLEPGDGFYSLLPLCCAIGWISLEEDLRHAAPALVTVIYSSLDWMPPLRPHGFPGRSACADPVLGNRSEQKEAKNTEMRALEDEEVTACGTKSREGAIYLLAAGSSPLSSTAASPYGSCPCDLDHNERTWLFPLLARPLKG